MLLRHVYQVSDGRLEGVCRFGVNLLAISRELTRSTTASSNGVEHSINYPSSGEAAVSAILRFCDCMISLPNLYRQFMDSIICYLAIIMS